MYILKTFSQELAFADYSLLFKAVSKHGEARTEREGAAL